MEARKERITLQFTIYDLMVIKSALELYKKRVQKERATGALAPDVSRIYTDAQTTAARLELLIEKLIGEKQNEN